MKRPLRREGQWPVSLCLLFVPTNTPPPAQHAPHARQQPVRAPLLPLLLRLRQSLRFQLALDRREAVRRQRIAARLRRVVQVVYEAVVGLNQRGSRVVLLEESTVITWQ